MCVGVSALGSFDATKKLRCISDICRLRWSKITWPELSFRVVNRITPTGFVAPVKLHEGDVTAM